MVFNAHDHALVLSLVLAHEPLLLMLLESIESSLLLWDCRTVHHQCCLLGGLIALELCHIKTNWVCNDRVISWTHGNWLILVMPVHWLLNELYLVREHVFILCFFIILFDQILSNWIFDEVFIVSISKKINQTVALVIVLLDEFQTLQDFDNLILLLLVLFRIKSFQESISLVSLNLERQGHFFLIALSLGFFIIRLLGCGLCLKIVDGINQSNFEHSFAEQTVELLIIHSAWDSSFPSDLLSH